MSASRMIPCLFVAFGLVWSGCALETADERLSDESISVPLDPMGGPGDPTDLPPGSQNGFVPLCGPQGRVLAAFRHYAVQRLWNPTMGTDYGTLPGNSEMDQVPTTCREEALKYLIRCALPRDTFTIDPVTGARYWGWLNLAPNWRTTSLAVDEQWWVTACVYQHLNGYDAEVPILLDGARPELFAPNTPHPVFEKRDSRIWGNMFAGTGEFVPDVCFEYDFLTSCTELSLIDTRICDSDPDFNCHVNIVGACKDVCTYDPDVEGYYCGTGGYKNIGSRLKDFPTLYGASCNP
jgi:hypothetical protein